MHSCNRSADTDELDKRIPRRVTASCKRDPTPPLAGVSAGRGGLRPHPGTREGAAMDDDTSRPRPPAGVVDDDHRFAAWTAEVAGRRLLSVRGQGLQGRELKDAGDEVSHDLLMGLLAEYRPGDAVLSEEGKDDKARLERRGYGSWTRWTGPVSTASRPATTGRSTWPSGRTAAGGRCGCPARPGHDVPTADAPRCRRSPRPGRGSSPAGHGRRPSSRCSRRRWMPSWCRWGRRARR